VSGNDVKSAVSLPQNESWSAYFHSVAERIKGEAKAHQRRAEKKEREGGIPLAVLALSRRGGVEI